MSSEEFDKYKYFTGEKLGYKPGVVEQGKIQYSPLGKVFNKGLEEDDKKERILKGLGNIKGVNKKELQASKNEHLKMVKR